MVISLSTASSQDPTRHLTALSSLCLSSKAPPVLNSSRCSSLLTSRTLTAPTRKRRTRLLSRVRKLHLKLLLWMALLQIRVLMLFSLKKVLPTPWMSILLLPLQLHLPLTTRPRPRRLRLMLLQLSQPQMPRNQLLLPPPQRPAIRPSLTRRSQRLEFATRLTKHLSTSSRSSTARPSATP